MVKELKKLRILPLGGLGEIGMNCLILEWQEELILIDCGVQFPDSFHPGVDFLLPDLNYVLERIHKLQAIVVTHGHDDHIGAIPFLAKKTPLTVYATPFPTALLQQKLIEHSDAKEICFELIEPRKKFQIGSFGFDPIPVQHSIIESVAFAITTPVGVVVHTGDFKHEEQAIQGKKMGFEVFEEYGNQGVALLLSDSTNAERIGHTVSELDITKSFEKIFEKQTGRIFIALFASNIARIEHFLLLAHKLGKRVALVGRSMLSYTRIAKEQNSLQIPADTLIWVEDLPQYPDNQVIVLMTGSQAEERSALVRVAQGTHKDIKLKSTDTVILSSRFIPGNEKAITMMIDAIYRKGAEVVYESIHQIHVSGHGFQEELKMMLNAVRPTHFIPIHGEYRHLAKHAKLAGQQGIAKENIFIIENGQSVLLSKEEGLEIGESFDFLKIPVCETKIMEASNDTFLERLRLSEKGVAFLVIARNKKTGKMLGHPKFYTYGMLLQENQNIEEIVDEVAQGVEELYPEIAEEKPAQLAEKIRIEVRKNLRRYTYYRPVTIPVVLDL